MSKTTAATADAPKVGDAWGDDISESVIGIEGVFVAMIIQRLFR
jgi:hypothetical protein